MYVSRRARGFTTLLTTQTVTAQLAKSEDTTNTETTRKTTTTAGPLTLYNAQHDDLITAMVDGFTEQTGIKVEIRSGDDAELANQIVAEGKASPADVFVTENSPSIDLVSEAGLLAPVEKSPLAQVPSRYSPSDGSWISFAAQSTVLANNSDKLTEAQLPASRRGRAGPA